VLVTRDEAAGAFLGMLAAACEGVGDRWFVLPVASSDGDPSRAYRERVYCYELYHQLRLLERDDRFLGTGTPEYALSGEIDKAGLNAVIKDGREKPDLVWHVPGLSCGNAVVVEVKSAGSVVSSGISVDRVGLRKDVGTLGKFLSADHRSYAAGVLLLYGAPQEEAGALRRLVLRQAHQAFAEHALDAAVGRRIHMFLHPAPRRSVIDLGTIALQPTS
jgi:hypothetical protein